MKPVGDVLWLGQCFKCFKFALVSYDSWQDLPPSVKPKVLPQRNEEENWRETGLTQLCIKWSEHVSEVLCQTWHNRWGLVTFYNLRPGNGTCPIHTDVKSHGPMIQRRRNQSSYNSVAIMTVWTWLVTVCGYTLVTVVSYMNSVTVSAFTGNLLVTVIKYIHVASQYYTSI